MTMEFTPSTHQVAGHKGSVVAKGMFAKPSSNQEIEFYQQLHKTDGDKSDDLGNLLLDWVPLFYGTLMENQLNGSEDISRHLHTIQSSAQPLPASVLPTDKQYILLSNLYEDFNKPSILDIKLGSKLTDELASPEKAQRLQAVSNSTTSGSLSMRICGMKLYHRPEAPTDFGSTFPNTDGISLVQDGDDCYLKFDKFFGRSLGPADVRPALELFIYHGVSPTVGDHYVAQFHKRLQLLYNCLLSYEVSIVSGSLLFIIENDEGRTVDLDNDPLVLSNDFLDLDLDLGEEEAKAKQLSSLHLIDFAHSKFVPGQGIDENIIEGVESLLDIFGEMLPKDP